MIQLKPVSDVINDYSGRPRRVLEYSMLMKELVDQAKQPGFSPASWERIAPLFDTENFVRVGNFKEVMRWQDYIGFLTPWAMSSEWECSFKRITEHGNLIFLELEERSKVGDYSNAVNSLSVYEFNSNDQIVHLDIYLQMELPPAEMLQSYAGAN